MTMNLSAFGDAGQTNQKIFLLKGFIFLLLVSHLERVSFR